MALALGFVLAACGPATPEPPSPGAATPIPSPVTGLEPSPTQGGSSVGSPVEVPTPDCAVLGVTHSSAEGPYYKPGSPERASLLDAGIGGTRLVLRGFVVADDCDRHPGAWLDFWQADADGAYDNEGYRLRGHQFADSDGAYRLETILPGPYGSRPRHIHVKVEATGLGAIGLTTQLFFPSEITIDSLFDPALVLQLEQAPDGEGFEAVFHFVLAPRPMP